MEIAFRILLGHSPPCTVKIQILWSINMQTISHQQAIEPAIAMLSTDNPTQPVQLNDAELEQAGGGVLPLVGLALSVAGKVSGSSGVIGWAISSTSVIVSTFEAAKYLGGLKES